MGYTTAKYVDKFWHLLDVLLNGLLFVLMGLKILTIQFEWQYVWLSILLIPLFIGARYIALFIPHLFASKFISIQRKRFSANDLGFGLRGGLSIAMALSLSNTMEHKKFVVTITYGIVIFSIFLTRVKHFKISVKSFTNNNKMNFIQNIINSFKLFGEKRDNSIVITSIEKELYLKELTYGFNFCHFCGCITWFECK